MPSKKEDYNGYMREYMIRRYHSKRKEMIEQLGSACASCGSTDNLEIDHIDRSKKTMKVGRSLVVSSKLSE